MQLVGRTYSSGNYRYGFNGKENDSDVKGEGNQQDYGMRIYDPRVGRFMSIDPLQRSFPALSPYAFAGNGVTFATDMDGLEPVPANPNTETLVIMIQGISTEPPPGNTQTYNAYNYYLTKYKEAESQGNKAAMKQALEYMQGFAYDGALNGGIVSSGPSLQIVTFASSTSNVTKDDVVQSIKNFRSIHPNGRVILVGHSQGADNIVELAKENKDIHIDLIITLDIKDKDMFSIDDDDIPSNVKNAINYYQENESFGIGGEKIEIDDQDKTNGTNILSPGSNHRSIDNDLSPYISEDINNFLKGKDAVKIATERKLPTFKPDSNKTPYISKDKGISKSN
jgi:RHS repeat-associated protein